mgnify:CR=1 FL=1
MFCIFLQSAEERKVKVFQKGERVVCGSKGVCVVEEITTLDIAGVDRKREYYILKPLYLSSSTVYIPVDTAEGSMRKVLAHEEAESLIRQIPEIPLIRLAGITSPRRPERNAELAITYTKKNRPINRTVKLPVLLESSPYAGVRRISQIT